MNVTFDKHSLIIDGKREFIRSGAFHYFRTPSYELAKDRFMKMKAGGYNTVEIYFWWKYHSEKQGEYDFTGLKDIEKVLEAAREVGLYVISRPGPFINSEVSAGGFPLWLLKDKDVIPRNRIGTEYHYSEKYMEYITEWYDHIIPIINKFDNVILFQIENEYANDEMDETYMRKLYDMARERGIKCPIYHNDAAPWGLWADVVDIYACDTYLYINPNQDWRKDNFCFDTMDNLEGVFECKENAPAFIAEMQSGWFDKWDGSGYEHIRKELSDQHINLVTKTAISQGVTIFNHYMCCGGTSWGNIACDEVYTSYDFTAPIDEYGVLEDNYFKAKEINYFLKSFGLTNTESDEDLEINEEGIYTKVRKDNENDCKWLFLRNLNPEAKTIKLFDKFSARINPYDMKICPINLKLYACEIEFSDIEVFARLKNDEKETIFLIADENASMYLSNGDKISGNKKDFDTFKFEKDGKSTRFVFLTREATRKTWITDKRAIFNADYVAKDDTVALEHSAEIAYYDLKHGFSKKYFKTRPQTDHKKTLKNLEVSFCAPEIDTDYDYSSWRKIKGDKLDSLSCDLSDEFTFYKGKIPKNIEEITLSARHLFAVYINGKEILSRNSYKIEKLQQIPETIQIHLDKKVLNKEENELTILVENLGFDKGFSGETNHPRGLVTFETSPKCDIEFYVNEKLSIEREDYRESDAPYLAKISASFDVTFREDEVFSKYLYLKDFPYRRATIFLNGVKIGRYIKRANVQDKFYLINAFLKEHNTIDIVVWQKGRNIHGTWDFKNEMKNVILEVGDVKRFQLF